MKTRERKIEELKNIENLLHKSKYLIFFQFEKIPTLVFQEMKKRVDNKGIIKMIKKTLLKIALNKKGVEFDPLQYKTQISTLFTMEDLPYNVSLLTNPDFRKNLNILAIYDVQNKKLITDEEIIKILSSGSLQDILSKLVFLISSPLRKLLYVLNKIEKGRR